MSKPYNETQMVVNIPTHDCPDDFLDLLVEAAQRCAERTEDSAGGFAVVTWDSTGSFRQCAFMNSAPIPADLVPEMVKNAVENGMVGA